MKVYPIFLNNLDGRRCVVIGGNHEAERKVNGLLACDAAVVVIAPYVTPPLAALAAAGALTWLRRGYRRGDLQGAFLAIVAETNPEATAPIWAEAEAEKVLLNAMDDIPHCTFVAGSVVQQGPLTLSISTSGAAPALSVRLRQRFEAEFGPAYGTFLEWMRDLRPVIAARFPDFEERRRRWYALVDADVLDLLKQGKATRARQRVDELLAEEV